MIRRGLAKHGSSILVSRPLNAYRSIPRRRLHRTQKISPNEQDKKTWRDHLDLVCGPNASTSFGLLYPCESVFLPEFDLCKTSRRASILLRSKEPSPNHSIPLLLATQLRSFLQDHQVLHLSFRRVSLSPLLFSTGIMQTRFTQKIDTAEIQHRQRKFRHTLYRNTYSPRRQKAQSPIREMAARRKGILSSPHRPNKLHNSISLYPECLTPHSR